MTSDNGNPRWVDSPWPLMIAATFLGALLRLSIAPHFDFYGDEFFTLEWGQKTLREIQSSFGPGITMHLYILIMKGWGSLVGYSPWTMKLPSLVAGIALFPLLFRLGTHWLDRRTAAVAVAIAVTSSPLIVFSRTARVYAILALGVVVSMMIFSRAIRSGSFRYLLLSAIVNASLMAFSLHSIVVLAIQGTSVAIESIWPPRLSVRRLVGLGASFVLALALSLAFYSSALPKIVSQLTGSSVSESASVMLSRPLEYRPKLFLQLWLPFSWNHSVTPVIMLVFLILGIFVACRWHGIRGRLLVLWAVLPPIFYLIVPFGFVPDSIARYLIPFVVAQILLIALGALWPLKFFSSANRLSPWIAFCGAIILTLSSTSVHKQLFLQSEPSSLTLRHVVEIAQPGDLVTSFPGHYQSMIELRQELMSAELSELINNPDLSDPGRLIIILRSMPQAGFWWLDYFEGYEVGGPGYSHSTYILVSPRLSPGPKSLVDPMRHFYYGFLHAMAEEGTLHRYPSLQFSQLRRVHRRLARLSDLAGHKAEAQEHLVLAQNPNKWLMEDFHAPEIMQFLERD